MGFQIEPFERRQLLANILAFTAGPTTTDAGEIINAPTGVQVTVETAGGVPIMTSADSITISLGTNSGHAVLAGTLTENAVNGVATFSDLRIAVAADRYTLSATDASDVTTAPAASAAFNVAAVPYFSSLFSLAYGPSSRLIADAQGNLYGTTTAGGAYGDGSVFELSGPGLQAFTTLISFTGTGGSYPGLSPGNLVIDSAGNLYGSTGVQSTTVYGTLFELASNHTTFSNLYTLTEPAGSEPPLIYSLVLDPDGDLFGAEGFPFPNSPCSVFELAADHETFTTLHVFSPNSFSYYPNSLTLDSSGDIFGTTFGGGTDENGTIFEISADHTTFTTLISFTGTSGSSGTDPGLIPSGLIVDSSGNLYGSTTYGGSNLEGEIYELAANHTTFRTLINFSGPSGANPGAGPLGDLLLDSNGNLYGLTDGQSTGNVGAYAFGTAYELDANHSSITSLVVFTGSSGGFPGFHPFGGLTLADDGNLFGVTSPSTPTSAGTIFEINPAGTSELTVTSGSLLVAAPKGNSTSQYFPTVSIAAGANLTLTPAAAGPTVLETQSLSIAKSSGAWAGQLDLTNNDLDITQESLATATSEVAQGYNGGAWNGQGIISSTAASDSTHLTAVGVIQNNQYGSAIYNSTNLFDGVAPGAADILVKYTYYGDANLSGKVDGSDYTLIDNGFNNHLTGWLNGDFNYDGIVDGSDYTLIDNAFNTQTVSLAASIAAKPAALMSSTERKLLGMLPDNDLLPPAFSTADANQISVANILAMAPAAAVSKGRAVPALSFADRVISVVPHRASVAKARYGNGKAYVFSFQESGFNKAPRCDRTA